MKCHSHVHSPRMTSRTTAVDLLGWSIYPVLGDEAIKVVGYSANSHHKKCSGSISIRVNPRCVLSKSGTMYNLSGPIQDHSNLPSWLIEEFRCGFPSDWKKQTCKYLEWLQTVQSDAESDEDVKDDANVKHSFFKWAVHVHHSQIFVEGFVLSDNGVPQLYRTSAIQEAVTSRILKTMTGSRYALKGPICLESTLQAKIPLHFAHKFDNGFPLHWKELVPKMVKFTETANTSFHETAEELDTTSVHSKCQEFKKPMSPIEWPTFLSESSGGQDTTLDVSDISTEVQVPSTVRSVRTAKYTVNDDDLADSLSVDSFQTPTNSRMLKKSSNVRVDSTSSRELRNGFYRTRSGRHVLPPLQHWTGQRLVRECDDSGTELMVLYPGDKSRLEKDTSSPAQDALRTNGWLRRQYKMNQLLHSASQQGSTELQHVKMQSTYVNKSPLSDARSKPCSVVITPLSSKTKKCCSAITANSDDDQVEYCGITKRSLRKRNRSNSGAHVKEQGKNKISVEVNNKKTPGKRRLQQKYPKDISNLQQETKGTAKQKQTRIKQTKKTSSSNEKQNKKISISKKRKADEPKEKLHSKKKRISNSNTMEVEGIKQKQDTAITARKGTLRHRRQVKAVLGATKTENCMDDCFSSNQKSHNIVANSLPFSDSNFDLFMTAVTPTAKLSQNFTTPRWFKTPAACLPDNSLANETPAHLRAAVSVEKVNKQTSDESDRAIIQVQKMKLKTVKATKIKMCNTPKRKKPSENGYGAFKDLFNHTTETDHSSDDEYFSDD